MKAIITIIIFIISLFSCHATVPSCSSTAPCFSYPNARCIDGYCACKPGFSFNCSTISTNLAQGATTLSIAPNSVNYYVLEGSIGTSLDYEMTMSDSAQSDMLSVYSLQAYIDDGVGQAPNYPQGQLWNLSSQLHIQLQATLKTIQDSSLSQTIVLNITYTGTSTASLSIDYSYSAYHYSNLLLILGYSVGGILIFATLVLMVLVYRKRRQEDEERPRRQAEEGPEKFDITHFDIFMPAVAASLKDRQQSKTCSVCLLEFEGTSRIRNTPCGHLFHKDCLDQWCLKSMSCPNCRTDFSFANLTQLRVQKSRQDDSSWIVNSMAEQQEDQQPANPVTKRPLREPLFAAAAIDNNDL